MSISLRNLEEHDLDAAQALVTSQVGPDLVAAGYTHPDFLRPHLIVDTAFTLVAENPGITGMVSVLMEQETPSTVVGLLCRLYVQDSPARLEIASNLVATALRSLESNLQLCIAEIPARDLWSLAACEQAGFVPCGFLYEKFHGDPRASAVVYSWLPQVARSARRSHPNIIPSVRDLAVEVLQAHGILDDTEVREDAMAYPTEATFILTPIDAEAVQTMLPSQTQQEHEVFPCLQGTQTQMHFPAAETVYLAAKDGEKIVGVIGYRVDAFDKRIQIQEVVGVDGEPQGFMVASLLEQLTLQYSPDYWEVLVSAHVPRMQKTFDQLGFVPCAFIPSFCMEHGSRSDAIKMVKLVAGYENETSELTSSAKNIFSIIDSIFRDHSVGNAVLKLLKDLRIFRGLGEGELRRVARLFSQKLMRPGEVVFEEGSQGQELYVVERGEIEIRNKDQTKLLGTIKSGAVLGEIAFLNGEPRTATAVSKSASIVRVIVRSDFDKLLQREIHLGLIFFRNVALDLADKLKQSVVQGQVK